MNASHKENQKQKRVRRIQRRLKDGIGADRKEKLEKRLGQLS